MVRPLTVLLLLAAIGGIVEGGLTLSHTMCYSPCSECSQSASNCTVCGSSLVIVSNQCVVNSRESVLASEFFPISSTVGAPLSTKALDTKTQSIDNCTYTDTNTPMYFLQPNGTFERFYNRSQVPPHKFINIRLTFLQKDWTTTDFVFMLVNNRTPVEIAHVDPMASPGGVNCQMSMTYVGSIEYSFSDAQPTLNISFDPHLAGSAVYGLNTLLVRYGNCHESCDTCFGSGSNNCESCKSFLQYFNSTCLTCDSPYFLRNNACWRCDTTCVTCSGAGPTNCLSCNETEAILVNNSCLLHNKNTLKFAHDMANSTFTTGEGWQTSTGIAQSADVSQCGRYSYLGGYQLGSSETSISKVYSKLPQHFALRVQLTIILVDFASAALDYQLFVDGTLYPATITIEGTKTNECGQNLPESLIVIRSRDIVHNSSTLSVKFKPNITTFSHYGVRDVSVWLMRCGSGCRNCDAANSSVCTECQANLMLRNGVCENCPPGHYQGYVGCQPCNILCSECTGPTIHECTRCDLPLTLNNSKCEQVDGYVLYGLFLNDKDDDVDPQMHWNMYPALQNHGNDKCGNYRILGNSELRYRAFALARTFEKLPKHTALSIHFFFHQIDDHTNQTTVLDIEGKQTPLVPVDYGESVCGNGTRDAIRKIVYEISSHTAETLSFAVRVTQMAKVGLSNFLIFLKDCPRCHDQLTYVLDYLPINDLDHDRHGLQVWMDFNDRVINMSEVQSFLWVEVGEDRSWKRLLGQVPTSPNYTIEQIHNESYKLFLPLNDSHLNAALTALIDSTSQIVNDRSSQDIRGYQKPLVTSEGTSRMIRFDRLPSDGQRRTVQGLHNFLMGLASAVLYISMVLVLFGLYYLIDDFAELLQVLFLFIFIETRRLPISLSYPLSGLQCLQFLNYLTEDNRHQVERWFLPRHFYQPSPHVFQQYQPDVNFLRAVSALIILNICYLVLRVVGWVLFRYVKVLKEKSYNPHLRFWQNLHEKSYSFLDGVLRFEFLAIIWANLLQFSSFTSSFTPFSQINCTVCVLWFILWMVYPICGFLFLRTQYNYMTNDQYEYLYQDSFHTRLRVQQTPNENRNPYLYFMFKYYRTFIIGLVVCLAGIFQEPLVAIIPILFILIGEILWVAICDLYTDKVCRIFKLVENSLLLVLLLLLLVVYGTAGFMPTDHFLQLGYACTAVVLMIVMSGLARLVYLAYLRIKQFGRFKHNLTLQAIQNNNVNQTQKQLLRSRTKQLAAGPMVSNIVSMKKSMKSVMNTSQMPIGRQITSINRLVE